MLLIFPFYICGRLTIGSPLEMNLFKPAIVLIVAFSSLQQVIAQDDHLRINMLQVIGSHSSYKEAIEPSLYRVLASKDTASQLSGLEYEHISISKQLTKGLGNLEIDVYTDGHPSLFESN